MAEQIGSCESCNTPIRTGDQAHFCDGGQMLCADHAPVLSDLIRQYVEVTQAEDFDPGELEFDDREEMIQVLDQLRADIEANGDRKLLVTA